MENLLNWGSKGLILLGILVAILVLIVVITIAMALVGTYFNDPNAELEGEAARAFVAQRFLPLPENASDIYLYYFSLQNFQAYIRFSASPEAFEAWIDSSDLCFSNLSSSNPIYNTSGEILFWWKPSENFSNADVEPCETSTNPSYQIAIDQSDSDLWIVYLAIFGS